MTRLSSRVPATIVHNHQWGRSTNATLSGKSARSPMRLVIQMLESLQTIRPVAARPTQSLQFSQSEKSEPVRLVTHRSCPPARPRHPLPASQASKDGSPVTPQVPSHDIITSQPVRCVTEFTNDVPVFHAEPKHSECLCVLRSSSSCRCWGPQVGCPPPNRRTGTKFAVRGE